MYHCLPSLLFVTSILMALLIPAIACSCHGSASSAAAHALPTHACTPVPLMCRDFHGCSFTVLLSDGMMRWQEGVRPSGWSRGQPTRGGGGMGGGPASSQGPGRLMPGT